MVWFKVDDGFANSRAVLKISRRYRSSAVGLWTLAGAWSAKELTDGSVPEYALEELCGTVALANRLVEADLWIKTPDGWKFKGWEKYQPLRADVLEGRDKEAERKRLARASSKRPPGQTAESRVDDSRSPDTPTRPDPTHSSSNEEEVPRKRGHRIPEDFAVTAEMVSWAKGKAPAVDGKTSTERFKNHFEAMTGRGSSKLDWVKAWKNWLLSDQAKAEERGWKPQAVASKPMTTDELRAKRQEVMNRDAG